MPQPPPSEFFMANMLLHTRSTCPAPQGLLMTSFAPAPRKVSRAASVRSAVKPQINGKPGQAVPAWGRRRAAGGVRADNGRVVSNTITFADRCGYSMKGTFVGGREVNDGHPSAKHVLVRCSYVSMFISNCLQQESSSKRRKSKNDSRLHVLYNDRVTERRVKGGTLFQEQEEWWLMSWL